MSEDEKAARRAARRSMFKEAVANSESLARTRIEQGEDYTQHLYDDYETYRRTQEEGNKLKLRAQFVKKGHIVFLADWLAARRTVGFGLCHGVRRGKEQEWFMSRLPSARVIGTDISETAKEFPDTVQWDFHDENPEWAGRADFVYSNSWDHAYDPSKAFRAWAASLKPGGVILIDHTRGHAPRASNALDPFGATREGVVRIMGDACRQLGRVTDVLDRSGDAEYPCEVVVFTRNDDTAA
ncbi:class I SAM-dependent methyltransferase [Paragemmobacter straminiformis]|uniref:Class I SAM-dependent methyltransferase n=1 Tax=Paragemmobacter straminiformis TaxID=2045119 RepID=A0A842I484_9RHOB|nr:methyltransferase domain-containing protein [Gemmobacter straminiformis]MBC2834391.1 class I SAM-dependent methyltransferase [Gemmobacter straminiformis]